MCHFPRFWPLLFLVRSQLFTSLWSSCTLSVIFLLLPSRPFVHWLLPMMCLAVYHFVFNLLTVYLYSWKSFNVENWKYFIRFQTLFQIFYLTDLVFFCLALSLFKCWHGLFGTHVFFLTVLFSSDGMITFDLCSIFWRLPSDSLTLLLSISSHDFSLYLLSFSMLCLPFVSLKLLTLYWSSSFHESLSSAGSTFTDSSSHGLKIVGKESPIY